MPSRTVRIELAAALCLAGLALCGCVAADAGVATFSIRPEPDLAFADDGEPSRTEAAYARDTARILFKRRAAERTVRFVSGDPAGGYALCLRADGDYAVLVFPRRLFEAAISQVEDDIAILRSKADTASCRMADGWTRV